MTGRPKTFDINRLLDTSVELFWRQGYQGTSIRDVAKAANLTTGTLYNEFGGKDDLYAATLERYFLQVIKPRVDTILLADEPECLKGSKDKSGFARLHFFLTSSVHKLPASVAHQACLLINTSNELGPGDTPIHKVLDKANRYINNAIKAVLLNEASPKGDMTPASIKRLLLQLHIFMTGLLITAKQTKDTKILLPSVDAFVSQLKLSIHH
ncbi:MAG: TetR/AcrR family transcriptional repressor of nem operon [Bermanella sp.]|jgi:TetR/AcrR family transcriptional repressor of nem operon